MAAYTALEEIDKLLVWTQCVHIGKHSICMLVDTFMECIQYVDVDDASLHVNMFVLSEAGCIEPFIQGMN